MGLLMLAASAAVLVIGAELFVENAAGAARRLGVTALAVGLLLAGAEPEEMVTTVIAALNDRPALAVGDAIGANLTMFTLALGVAALARPLPFGGRVRLYAVVSAAAGGLALLALADGFVSRLEGALLIAAYAAAVGWIWRRERQPPAIGELAEVTDDDGDQPSGDRALRPLALAVVGIGVMLGGGVLAVEGAERTVLDLGVSDSAVGLTLLALATTAELFALAWSAARRNVSELAVAAVVGSAAYNATVSLGAAALARPLEAPGFVPAAIGAAMLPLVAVALGWSGRLGRLAGLALVAGYALFFVAAFR